MHRNICTPIEYCLLYFFHKNTLARHLVQWNIGALVARTFNKN
jgi:hypothetical protein